MFTYFLSAHSCAKLCAVRGACSGNRRMMRRPTNGDFRKSCLAMSRNTKRGTEEGVALDDADDGRTAEGGASVE